MSKPIALQKRHYRKAKPGEIKCSRCKHVHEMTLYSGRVGLSCFMFGGNDIPVVGAKNTCDAATPKTALLDALKTIMSRSAPHAVLTTVHTPTVDRRAVLLRAAYDLLKKQSESSMTLNLLEETAFYDGTDCDGSCLMEDIKNELGIKE